MRTYRLLDNYRTVEFDGELLAEVSTETPASLRWTELALYRHADGRYVLHRVGRSVVFHVHEGECNTGVPTPVDKLPEDAEPCPRCLPTDAADVVDLEADRSTVNVCEDAPAVLDVLVQRRGGPAEAGFLSTPARRLLETVAQRDEAIAGVIHEVHRI